MVQAMQDGLGSAKPVCSFLPMDGMSLVCHKHPVISRSHPLVEDAVVRGFELRIACGQDCNSETGFPREEASVQNRKFLLTRHTTMWDKDFIDSKLQRKLGRSWG